MKPHSWSICYFAATADTLGTLYSPVVPLLVNVLVITPPSANHTRYYLMIIFLPSHIKSTISVSAVLWLCAFMIMGKMHGVEVSSVQSLLFPTNSHKWMPAMDGSIYVWNIVLFNRVWASFWPRSLFPWDLPCHKKSSFIVCLGHQAAKILSSLVTPYSRSLLHTRHGCWWMWKCRAVRGALNSLGNYSSHNVNMVSSIARCTTMRTPPEFRAFKTSLRPISSWTKKVT